MKLLYLVSLSFAHTVFTDMKLYNITAYGAKADGKTNNTAAIQKAIDLASVNGGVVLVPAGKFVTGVINLKSNVELRLATNSILLATTKRIDYGPGKASPLIVANDQQNISITGAGTIDGQADLLLKDIYKMLRAGTLKDKEWQVYNPWHQMRPEENNRPKLIMFNNCSNITIKNVSIKNGLCWIQDYRGCNNMVIDNIKVNSNTFLNNDGIDLVDCKNVKLTNSSFNVADDGICLKSEDPKNYCENIYIANCSIRSSASAFKIGTASYGGFKKINVKNINVYDTYRSAIAIESVDGAFMEDINVQDVTAKNTGNAIFIRLGKRKKTAPVGKVKGIYIANIKVQVPAGKPDAGYSMEGPLVTTGPHNIFPSSIVGLPGFDVQDVTLENIEISYAGSLVKNVPIYTEKTIETVPENSNSYPEFSMFGELPAWGFYVRHANNVKMKNVRLTCTNLDFRSACVFDNVKKLEIDAIIINKAKKFPVLWYNKVENQILKNIKIPVQK
ncbi:MAG: glycoside hydrolase family 28 protein [Janthinobacterium lividum]